MAIANSFTEFVPGHTHLQPVGRIASEAVHRAGVIAREFNTIAVDDGIAMGHGGMLYSLPSRELIAGSVEYMVNAHCADGLVCISNCDKITPGMLMAALRLNIPTVFVSGGPMEGGRTTLVDGTVRTGLSLVTAMGDSANPDVSEEDLARVEVAACPTCGSCSGMFTANSFLTPSSNSVAGPEEPTVHAGAAETHNYVGVDQRLFIANTSHRKRATTPRRPTLPRGLPWAKLTRAGPVLKRRHISSRRSAMLHTTTRSISLEDKYLETEGRALVTGIRRTRFALNDEELTPGLRSLAA